MCPPIVLKTLKGSSRSPLKEPLDAAHHGISESELCFMIMMHGDKIKELQNHLKKAVDRENWISRGVDLQLTKPADVIEAHKDVVKNCNKRMWGPRIIGKSSLVIHVLNSMTTGVSMVDDNHCNRPLVLTNNAYGSSLPGSSISYHSF
ncbi:hypothetical protein CDAR_244581 [Caerostris darwini]|uniref:Uncharacterized protein n=1 Tax=Caerostris darwini TaxID=1538125 RepID=A0AAV4RFV8_9ARAC|nr:hypothetical protein CDAR_244581 [Caerostris darwini]